MQCAFKCTIQLAIPNVLPFQSLQHLGDAIQWKRAHGVRNAGNGPLEQREDHANLHRTCDVSNVKRQSNAELHHSTQFLLRRRAHQPFCRFLNALHPGQYREARRSQIASCRGNRWSNAIANRSSIKNSITSAIQTSSRKKLCTMEKILTQSKQSSFSIADLFPIPPKTSIPQAILDCTPTALSAHAIGGGESL